MQELIQFLINIGEGVLVAVLGVLIRRQMQKVLGVAERTEQHAKQTEDKVSQIDLISTSSWRTSVDTRLEGLADKRSAQLGWQAAVDSELSDLRNDFDAIAQEWPAFRRFVLELDAYAHGKAPMPTLTPETQVVSLNSEGASS